MAKKIKKCKPNSGGFCMTHWSHIDEDSKVCEFVEVSRENKRLRDGIEALLRTGYEHTSDCERERSLWADLNWHPDCGRCWENALHDLLNPPQEEHDEFANITGDEAMRYGWTV